MTTKSRVSGPVSATVEVLTAEVRVLMVGSRQITLSVYRQLDFVDPDEIRAFGRVRDPRADTGPMDVSVVGTDMGGRLVRSRLSMNRIPDDAEGMKKIREGLGAYSQSEIDELYRSDCAIMERWALEVRYRLYWEKLPLIVLAGLT